MDRRVLSIFTILLSAGAFCACGQHGSAAPEEVFLKKLHAIETAVPPVWPGFNSAKAPLIIRFGNEGALLVGTQPKDSCGFRPVKDFFPNISEVPESSFFRPGPYTPWLRLFNLENFHSCAGDVYFSNYNLMQGILSRDVLFHEYFHSYQKRNFKWRYVRQVPPATLLPEQAAAAYIEQILLAKALRSAGADWEYYARAFCALRLHRKRLPDTYSFNPVEDYLEAIEGSAVYFESRTRDYDVDPAGALRSGSRSDAFPSQTDLHIAGELLMTEFTPDIMLYWRQYNTGAAQGLLLDRAGVDWKAEVEGGRSFFSVFSAVFAGPEIEQHKLVAAAKSEYDYPGLVSAAGRIMFPRETLFAGNDYAGRIVIRTCGNYLIEPKHQPGGGVAYHFSDHSSGMPYESLKIDQKGAFSFNTDNFVTLASLRDSSSGKECRRLEISLVFPLSRLSVDKTDCVATQRGFDCNRLIFYGVSTEARFDTPVKLSVQGKTFTVEVRP